MNLYVAVALLVVAPCCLGEGQSCQGQTDCASDECCTYFAPFRGRRQDSGVCKKRGSLHDKCFTENHFQHEGRYANICPCASGFACKSLGFVEVPFGEVGTCTPATKGRREEVESRETHCSTGADCPADQCCESLFKPIGRRQLISRAQGVCRPMGTVGSHCYANSASGKPEHMAFSCPCSAGLHCKGSGLFEVPLGEVGTCQTGATTRQAVESRETHCTSGADCPADQCCASKDATHLGQGVCKPLGHVGSQCLTTAKSGKHDAVETFVCPCSAHLRCIHHHVFLAPDFPIAGTCQTGTITRQAVQSRETQCTSGADCPDDQCCAVQDTHHLGQGVCKPLGHAGSYCFTTTKSGKHNEVEKLGCPCSANLHCVRHYIILGPNIPNLGQCKQPAEDESDDVSCQSGADCPSDQCCVELNRPIGRRQLRSSRVCRPMGTSGSSCLAKSTPGKPDHAVFSCPCSSGFHCKPNGSFDIPLGELGNCVADSH